MTMAGGSNSKCTKPRTAVNFIVNDCEVIVKFDRDRPRRSIKVIFNS
jgi:hypothetical protein